MTPAAEIVGKAERSRLADALRAGASVGQPIAPGAARSVEERPAAGERPAAAEGALRFVGSSSDWIAVIEREEPGAAKSGAEGAEAAAPPLLRVGPFLARTDAAAFAGSALVWTPVPLDARHESIDGVRSLLAPWESLRSISSLPCEAAEAAEGAPAATDARPDDEAGSTRASPPGVRFDPPFDSRFDSRLDARFDPGLDPALAAAVHRHAIEGLRLLLADARSAEATRWLEREFEGFGRLTDECGSALAIASSRFDPLLATAVAEVLEVHAAVLAERGESRRALEVRDDAVWFLGSCGAPVLAARAKAAMPARVARSADGAVESAPLLMLEECFPRWAWELRDGLARAAIRREALVDGFREMLDRVSRAAALDESARDRLGRALAVLAWNLPAHAEPSQSDLREVERHLVDMLSRVGSMPGHGAIKTAVWEAWGRLAGERRLLAPTERLRLAEQHAEVRAVALGIFAARGYDAASLPHLVAELDRTLSDPWAAWVRFPMARHWRRAFDDSVSSTASYLDDPEGASNEANFLEESMLLDVRSAMAGSWGWDRSDARGRRTCPFFVSGQGLGGSTHEPYRSGIQ